jgi:hypothetical protein
VQVKIALGVGLAISFFLSIPRFVIMGHQTLTFDGTDVTGTSCGVTDYWAPTTVVTVYNGVLVLWFLAMCFTMNVSYAQIGCFLWRHKRQQRYPYPFHHLTFVVMQLLVQLSLIHTIIYVTRYLDLLCQLQVCSENLSYKCPYFRGDRLISECK